MGSGVVTPRRPGPSARLKLTASYAAFLLVAGLLVLAVVWRFLLHYVPERAGTGEEGFMPGRADLERAFVPVVSWALVLLVVVGVAGGWILAGRMLAPLRLVTTATAAVAAGSLDHRIAMPGRRDEFRDLADGFDAMAARLEAHVAEQQRFAANASHELRTPLSVMRSVLDTARRDPDRDVDEVLARLDAASSRAIELTEALLVLGRADRHSFTPEAVDLSLAAEEVAEEMLPLAEDRGISLEVDAGAAATVGSRALIQQLMTNLVHNGIVHNLPDGGAVSFRTTTAGRPAGPPVNVRTDRRHARIVVENSGPLVDPAIVPTLTERFQRGSTRVHSGHHGTGLGLAIVASIAAAHGARLSIEPRPDGGLRVVVDLPPMAPGS
ncbi:putative two-component system sensor kinase [Actinomycetales bacterium JB111]|nr:putative two-component system sensor kinase [Actinomycetales bacterium JB111]